MVFERRPLREQVVAEILDRLQSGQYAVGARIDEHALQRELPVSRTPIREALSVLAYDGIIEARMGNGYWVTPLTEKDARDTYPAIVALEQLALTLMPMDALGETVANLRIAADHMERVADDPVAAQRGDDVWHLMLVRPSGNDRLEQTLTRLKRAVRRAEYALMQNHAVVMKSVTQHRRIADALEAGDLATAKDILECNWRDSMHRMIACLGSSDEAGEPSRRHGVRSATDTGEMGSAAHLVASAVPTNEG